MSYETLNFINKMRRFRTRLIQISACVMAGVSAGAAIYAPADAAELIMIEEEYCSWCERWDKEIGEIYDLTAESCYAPLRRIDIADGIPPSISSAEPVIYTPTFLLVHENRETGRITGYPGEDFFWHMLNELIAGIPRESLDSSQQECANS